MKQLFIAACLIVSTTLILSCKAKRTEAVAVPEVVIDEFSTGHPGITDVNWEAEKRHGQIVYIGQYHQSGKSMEADFDENGKEVGGK